MATPDLAQQQAADPALIAKLIKQYLEQNPAQNFETLNVEQLVVTDKLIVSDRVQFAKSVDWRFVGSQGHPPFTNSWAHFGAPYANASFMLLPDGFVQMHGMIKSGTLALAAFQLPPGFRPTAATEFLVFSNGVAGRVTVNVDGTVVPVSPSSNLSVGLDQIRFRAA